MLTRAQRDELRASIENHKPQQLGRAGVAALLEVLRRLDDLDCGRTSQGCCLLSKPCALHRAQQAEAMVNDLNARLGGAKSTEAEMRAQLTTWKRHVEEALRMKAAIRAEGHAAGVALAAQTIAQLHVELAVARLPWWRKLLARLGGQQLPAPAADVEALDE